MEREEKHCENRAGKQSHPRTAENVYFITGTAYAGKSTMVRLLAEKYDGICCGENYHDALMGLIDREHQPNLSILRPCRAGRSLSAERRRNMTPGLRDARREAAGLELLQLIRLSVGEKKILRIPISPLSVLREIGDYHRVAVLLSPQSMSVERFFDREDAESSFFTGRFSRRRTLFRPWKTTKTAWRKLTVQRITGNMRRGGFYTCLRREDSTIPEVLEKLERHFQLRQAG